MPLPTERTCRYLRAVSIRIVSGLTGMMFNHCQHPQDPPHLCIRARRRRASGGIPSRGRSRREYGLSAIGHGQRHVSVDRKSRHRRRRWLCVPFHQIT